MTLREGGEPVGNAMTVHEPPSKKGKHRETERQRVEYNKPEPLSRGTRATRIGTVIIQVCSDPVRNFWLTIGHGHCQAAAGIWLEKVFRRHGVAQLTVAQEHCGAVPASPSQAHATGIAMDCPLRSR
eukprot:3576312-Rhodomonas_salina.1